MLCKTAKIWVFTGFFSLKSHFYLEFLPQFSFLDSPRYLGCFVRLPIEFTIFHLNGKQPNFPHLLLAIARYGRFD